MALRRAKPTPPSFSSNVSASTASPRMRLSTLLDARDVVMCVGLLFVTENDDTDEAARATVVAATIDSFVMMVLASK